MKLTNNSVLILLPVFNESQVIYSVIKSIQREEWKNILVVDDGSTDDTYQKAKESGAIILRHVINRGKGAAIKTGLEAAKKMGSEIVVTLDSDGQHNPKDIKKMVKQIKKGSDVVLGIRDFRKRNIPRYKVFLNYLGNILTWMFYGLWVSDSQSGFRVYNKKAFSLIRINNDRYEFETEIVREIVRNNLKWTEKIVDVRYSDYDQNKKNKQSISSAIKTIIKLALFG
ncbi:Glycosyltransferase family 2 protein [Candidatus Roizmanbacteria bacterium]|nr:Glycosyltransferase family 2 protein [Candidatus Roizmanbacteria bacterium]